MKHLCSGKITSAVLTVIACALWGSLFSCIKLGYAAFHIASDDIPSIMLFAGMRFVISGIVLILIMGIQKRSLRLPGRESMKPIALVAFMTIILHYGFTYIGLALGEGSKSAIVKQVGFLFLSCFSFLFVKEDKFTPAKLIAGILGFLGIIVTGMDGTGFSFVVGDAVLILASFCTVTGNIISKKSFHVVEPVPLVAYSQLLGGICLSAVGGIMGGRIDHIDGRAAVIFAYICFASITAYALWNLLLKYNDLSRLSIIRFSEPLLAVVFAGALLGEDIFKVSYLAALIIILAAILICNLDPGEVKKHMN